jgi:arabinan endo-1,5-alpha-L-arabinosidase
MKNTITIFLLLILMTFNVSATNTAPLKSLISDCQKLLNQSSEGIQNGDYRTGAKQELEAAVTNATTILNDINTTQQMLANEVDNLFDSYTHFTKQRYGITPPNWSDNYWQFSATPSQWGPYNLHDPSVIKTDGYFYVFSTDAAWAASSTGIPVRRSRDLVNWEYRGWAFNVNPTEPTDWLKSQQPVGEAAKAVNGLWAPYIMKVGTQYRLYYSAVFEGGGALIGLATSENIEGPWVQVGKVISTYDVAISIANAIDPTVSIDKDGKHWMIYGSWSNGIYVFELDPVTGLRKGTTMPTLIAQNGPNNTWNWKSCMEGPEVIYNPKLGKYYLFLAQGGLGNVYHTRVARADKPQGPYYDYFGNNVAYTGTSPKYPEIYPLITYSYQFNNHPGWQGVSHVSVFSNGDDYYMMHQGRPSATAAMMVLHNRKITWTADGWPTVSPERYANTGIMPQITTDSIVGSWEEIQLNELKDASGSTAGRVTPVINDTVSAWKFLNTSKIASYKSDGTYTYGTETGRWKLSGDTLITTRLAKTFKGILSYEYDWENNRTALTYTGLRYDARSIWGKKTYTRQTNNIILNSTFDSGLTHWVLDKNGGSFTEQIVTDGINGNSFYAKSFTPASSYWLQQLRWLFPVAKCARYKVSFKAKASAACILNFEIQDNSSTVPIIRTTFKVGTTASTISFITQDVPTTSTLYSMNIAYGTLAAGNEIWIDDVTLEETTDQCNGNYITNGNLTDGINGWSTKTSGRFYGKMAIDSINRINSHPTIYCKVTTPTSSWTDALFKWSTHLHSGAKYVLEFSAKSASGLDIVPRLLNGTTVFSALEQTKIIGDVTNYQFVFPEITTAAVYTLEIDFGKSAAGSEAWLNNFSLSRCSGDCNNTTVNIPTQQEYKIYPNPAKTYFDLSTTQNVLQISIYSIDGKLIKTNQRISSNRIDVTSINAGSYIVKLQVGKLVLNRLLLIEK